MDPTRDARTSQPATCYIVHVPMFCDGECFFGSVGLLHQAVEMHEARQVPSRTLVVSGIFRHLQAQLCVTA